LLQELCWLVIYVYYLRRDSGFAVVNGNRNIGLQELSIAKKWILS